MTTPVPGSPEETTVDATQRRLSRFLAEEVFRFDSFFGDKNLDDEIQTPWLRVRGGVEWKEGWDFEFKQRFRIYLPLPILEKRLGAFIGSDEDGKSEDQDFFSDNQDDSEAAGLRYFFRQRENFDANINLGARLKSGKPVVYLKPLARFKFTWDRIYFEPRQYVYWYSDDGLGEETDLEFNYSVNRHILLRFEPDFVYSNTSQGVDFSQEIGLRYLDYSYNNYPHFAVNLTWNSSGHTHPSAKYDQHQLTLRFRHRIWRPWLRLEYGPRLTWKREVPGDGDDFEEYWRKHYPSFLVYLEVLFEDLLAGEDQAGTGGG